MATFRKTSEMPVSAEVLEQWHAADGAFERLAPPWQSVDVVEQQGDFADRRMAFRLRMGPLHFNWVAQHRDYIPGRQFVDEQVKGPLARWVHTHRFRPQSDKTCELDDELDYELPAGKLGRVLGGGTIAKDLQRAFTFRHLRTRYDLQRQAEFAEQPRQSVAITGASGLVGKQVSAFLQTAGHSTTHLVRRETKKPNEVHWDPAAGTIDAAGLEGLDTVIHLAGESIAGGRWTAARKRRIRDSRVEGTRLLCETLADLKHPPKTLVAASAIGFYGHGESPFDEQTPAGEGFLADVCQEWEAATEPSRQAGIRVVLLRIGVVLSPGGGALAKMQAPFSMGAGGVVGSGEQWMSWIALDDLVGIIHSAVCDSRYEGPINATSPQPATNRTFTKTLGKVLGRPTVMPLPAPAVRLAFGEMGQECLLEGSRVMPARLQKLGFQFLHADLECALRFELGRFDDKTSTPSCKTNVTTERELIASLS